MARVLRRRWNLFGGELRLRVSIDRPKSEMVARKGYIRASLSNVGVFFSFSKEF